MNRQHLPLALATFLVANAAAAAGGEAAGHGGHHEPHVANWWGMGEQYANTPALGWLTITFLIFVGVLVFFGRPAIKRHLNTRADVRIKTMLSAADDDKLKQSLIQGLSA